MSFEAVSKPCFNIKSIGKHCFTNICFADWTSSFLELLRNDDFVMFQYSLMSSLQKTVLQLLHVACHLTCYRTETEMDSLSNGRWISISMHRNNHQNLSTPTERVPVLQCQQPLLMMETCSIFCIYNGILSLKEVNSSLCKQYLKYFLAWTYSVNMSVKYAHICKKSGKSEEEERSTSENGMSLSESWTIPRVSHFTIHSVAEENPVFGISAFTNCLKEAAIQWMSSRLYLTF